MKNKIELKVCAGCEEIRPNEHNFCVICGRKLSLGEFVPYPESSVDSGYLPFDAGNQK